jgi:hypothetical protein
MTFQGKSCLSKIILSNYPSINFGRRNGQNEFSRLGDSMNNRFLEVNKFSLLSTKGAENSLQVLRDHPNHRFPKLAHVSFWAG